MNRPRAKTSPEGPLRLFFSVGDVSADLHAANLIREIRKLRPDTVIEGFGGPQMRDAGCDVHYPLTTMNVMGVRNVVLHLPKVWSTQRSALKHFEKHRPDAVVAVDFPGYNLALARWLRPRRIPVICYICPQIWAWMPGRIHKIRKRITKALCIFPFEEKIYRDAGVPVEYVGHPLFDHLDGLRIDEDFCRRLRREAGEVLIGLLPGSRTQEIRNLLPVMAKSARIIARELPKVLFALPFSGEGHHRIIRRILRKYDMPVRLLRDRTFEVMKESDFCMVTSGTATLELTHFNTPMMVMYRVDWPSYLVIHPFMRTEYIAMVNILIGREVVPDRLLWRDDAERLARDALDIIRNPDRKREVTDALRKLRVELDHPGASRQAAESILKTACELRGYVPDGGSQWPTDRAHRHGAAE
ncbi:MAG TPA: lipid-A-disaccharide synthase [Planctomycetota bacterium]|nr:lipid-A-disaccharide synthase [Planctomycetota bacterium]